MYAFLLDDCTRLCWPMLSSAPELLKFECFVNSVKTIKTGCYNFGIRAVISLGSVGVSLLSFCCVFLIACLA